MTIRHAARPALHVRAIANLLVAAAVLTAMAVLTATAALAADAPPDKPKAKPDSTEAPVVTHHRITVSGKPLAYTVTTGKLPLKNEQGESEAEIFFMAYTLDGVADRTQRPLMFSFNGGPGSSSVWLHLGALGPRRVKMRPDGAMPPPPYQLVDNPHTWLDRTDLCFIDPVGTGYSRASKPELGKKFWGLQGDLESVGEFIRLYLARYQRWGSPSSWWGRATAPRARPDSRAISWSARALRSTGSCWFPRS